MVFTGDFLFLGGCGYFNEGGPEVMTKSIEKLFSTCDEETFMFCGHEYSLNNFKFAEHFEPDNEALKEKAATLKRTVDSGKFSVPSTLQEELSYNPFVRCVMRYSELPQAFRDQYKTKEEALGAARSEKNNFR